MNKWSDKETRLLISTIEENNIMAALDGSKFRNAEIYKTLVAVFDNEGYSRTYEQLRTKWKALQMEYRKTVNKNGRSGSGKTSCPYYDELHSVLGGRPNNTFSTCDGVESAATEDPEVEIFNCDVTIAESITDGAEVLATGCEVHECSPSTSATLTLSTPSTSSSSRCSSAASSSSSTDSKFSKTQGSRKRKASYASTLATISSQLEAAHNTIASSTSEYLKAMQAENEVQRKWEEKQMMLQQRAQAKLMKKTVAQMMSIMVQSKMTKFASFDSDDDDSDDVNEKEVGDD